MARADMSKKGQLTEVLKKEVRSLLIAAKEGLTPAQLEQEYMAMIGKPLPVHDLGFQSTLELVADMPEVVRICTYGKGTFILKAITDETTKTIARLVARQRRSAKERKSAAVRAHTISSHKNPRSFPWRGKAPILPATVKAELQDLLSSSPLLLLDFHNAFFRRFGRAFEHTQYGFFSMFEVLKSVSDIIVVERTKAGSLLTLRKHLASEIKKEEAPRGETQEEAPRGKTREEMPRGETREEMPRGETREEMPRGETREEMPRGETREEVPRGGTAVEMPPLEPICETENCYLTTEEKSELVETQAVDLDDGFKQARDLQQSLLEKLIMTPEIPPDAVQDRSLCSLPPLKRRCLVGVHVKVIVSPSQFYIHVCTRETSDELQDMMVDMRRCYSHKLVSDRYIMPESSVQPGQLCCVMISKWWYRVVVHRVINDRDVEVFYPDYGNLEIVRKSWLRFLKWCYLKLPAQAIPCSLAWVKPMEGTWSNAAILLFKNLCSSKLLVGTVDEYVNGILHLFLCDTSTEEDVYFHCVLKDKGYADICGKNVPSEGFKELNPLALYVQPCEKWENAELVEPDLCLQQESLDADSATATSKLDGNELCDQQWHLSDNEETQDDVPPLLDEVSVPGTTDQDSELAQNSTGETSTDLVAVVKTPHCLEESSVPVVLFKSVKDFCTSCMCSKEPGGMNQDKPDEIERFSNNLQLREAVHPSVLLMAMPFMDNHNNEEQMRSKDHPGSLAVSLCFNSGMPDQGLSRKLCLPPTTIPAVLAAARLTSSSSYFHWLPSLRKKV
ncbi:tudor domain-containing protein 5 isoform X3 [Melopsittacus undulatus]|uniref:tudor domain-containing protein 5 isoform X3 n=1 Tax=Melopsittacus undulatus TaxID=13146 RepID=UPI00146E5C1B|nr:tudor domain-containing protein 5 isoform X3 [Melopsittacus undulatus]